MENKLKLGDCFHYEDMEFDSEKEGIITKVDRPIFLCHDPQELVNCVAQERDIDPNELIFKFSIDKGHDKLKAGLNLIEKGSFELNPIPYKKAKYSDGIAPSLHKSTSANMMQIIAMVPSIQESYTNVKKIIDNLPGMCESSIRF